MNYNTLLLMFKIHMYIYLNLNIGHNFVLYFFVLLPRDNSFRQCHLSNWDIHSEHMLILLLGDTPALTAASVPFDFSVNKHLFGGES